MDAILVDSTAVFSGKHSPSASSWRFSGWSSCSQPALTGSRLAEPPSAGSEAKGRELKLNVWSIYNNKHLSARILVFQFFFFSIPT